MRLLLIVIFLLKSLIILSQVPDTSQFIQYRILGSVHLYNQQKFKVRGLTLRGDDSIVLYNKYNINKTGTLIKVNDVYKYQAPAISGDIIAIESVKKFREIKHGFVKGASTGALIGFGIGYVFGYITYDEKFDVTSEDNDDDRKARAGLFGIGGTVTTGVLGGILGSIIIRKTFPINGKKENLMRALNKIRK